MVVLKFILNKELTIFGHLFLLKNNSLLNINFLMFYTRFSNESTYKIETYVECHP